MISPGEALVELILATCQAAGYEPYANHMPDKPDKAVVVYELATGRLEGRKMRTGEREEHPAVRLVIRSTDASGRTLAASIADLVDATYNFEVSDGQILRVITKSSTIGFSGQENQTRRFMYIQNYRLTLE